MTILRTKSYKMHYLKKLITLTFFSSPLSGISANSNIKDDPHNSMYRRLEADIRATRQLMPEYLKSKYESNLNEYNFNRLLEYNKLFNNLESEYLNIQNSALPIFKEFKQIKSLIEKRRLTTNEKNEILLQLNFLIEKLTNEITSLKETAKESQILSESWNNRYSQKIIEHHAKIFDPTNSFPILYAKISNDMENYNVSIFNAYIPGFNDFTQKYEEEDKKKKEERDKSLFVFLDNFFGSYKAESDHQQRLQELITELRETNILAVKSLDSQKHEIIKKSIIETMPDSFSRNAKDFNLRNEILELTNKSNAAAKSFEIKIQAIKDIAMIVSENLGQDLQKMIEAKSAKFIEALNQKRDLDLKVSVELDKEAQRIVFKKDPEIKNYLKKENSTRFEEAYTSLSEVFQNDALLAEKYLKNTFYNQQKDFLFNDKDFLNSYPINSWSVFIRQIFSETISQ